MRLLTQIEVDRLAVLSRNGVPVGLIEPTATGLGKSIMDAVEDFRKFLADEKVHDFSSQPQGPESKVLVPAVILTAEDHFVRADASLYRPNTKQGDPRIWFSRLRSFADAGDILAVAHWRGRLHVFDLTKLDLVELELRGGEFDHFMAPFFIDKFRIVEELRAALGVIAAKGFIVSEGSADTTVGMLLESELGIKANSSRAPDYKGIEIKAARANRTNRHNLFARVPDWGLSSLKSSQQILNAFGYVVDGRRQLYCTVAAERPNPQGLFLAIDESAGLLWEKSTRSELPNVVAWTLEGLEASLKEKHSETFWVQAESRKFGTSEEFRFVSVEHTSNPIYEQLTPLIASRHITMDHLNREKNGRAAERGPLFKLKHGSLGLLFPPSAHYDLVARS